MSGLEVANVRVTYPGSPPVEAVQSANLAVKRGETIALVGPSGCGKSTLLAAIAGIVPIVAGTITWDDADVAGVPVHERGFGMVFQDGQLFPHRDVAGNVAFGLEMTGVDKRERDERVEELLALVGLSAHARRRIDELSGGERQRVALARTLAPRPSLILLDEPMSSLDRELRDQLAEDLVTILRSSAATAILVTHDLHEATAIGTRVIRMAGGITPR